MAEMPEIRAAALTPTRELSLKIVLLQLFGSIPAQIGWFFLLLSSFVFWPLIAQPLYQNLLLSGPLQETSGVVQSTQATGLEQDGQAVLAHRVKYVVDSRPYEIYAYSNAQAKPSAQPTGPEASSESNATESASAKVPQTVTVRYRAQSPELAKVKGLRRLAVPNSALNFFLVFPAVAALLAGARLYRGLRDLTVLRRGLLVQAQRAPAPEGDLEKEVWRYQHAGQDYSLPAPPGEDETMDVLYLAEQPEQALRLSMLPGGLRLEADRLHSERGALALGLAFLPLWVLVSNLWLALKLLLV